ncbi:hypothetical protein [Micromonospora mirobrigensis]|uniref:Polymorphic outer membrane protein repeat-containing protein n=1 Tax=Micromonospora mirobrigensis TaxID=262898 RepID=A0A1C4X793_9ACTN|nr:hypothetical protein [Micromonospora mirobrigensis]SCF04051.1 hypothetical protein GA0070564_102750 [Micromonospora mirobrigensis]
MSNDVTTSDEGTPTGPPPKRRRALWVATGVAGLTGVVGLAALGGLAARENTSDDAQRRSDQQATTARQNVSDAGPAAEENVADGDEGPGRGEDRDAREAREARGHRDAKDEHGRVREVPCDDDKLVEALDLANRDEGGTIKLAEHCTYELDFADKKSGGALPTIKQEITIKGNDATIKRDSEDAFRLFRVADGGDLTLKDLTITGGNAAEFKYGPTPGGAEGTQATPAVPKPARKGEADGGALLVEHGGSAHLEKVRLIRNNAEGNGGAIANYGRVDVEQSVIEDNHAGHGGGGVFNAALLSVEKSRIVDNTAGDSGGGIANGKAHDKDAPHPGEPGDGHQDGGSVDIRRSVVAGNSAGHNGGGLFSFSGFVAISYGAVDRNRACASGGGVYANDTDLDLDHVAVTRNHAVTDGGGVVNSGGERWVVVTSDGTSTASADNGRAGHGAIADSRIADNTAGRFGGGIFNGETGKVDVAEGFGDRSGGRDDNASLALRHTEIKGNTALNGGGIFNNKGAIDLTGTRVARNTATDAAKLHRVAGGILNNEGTVRLDDESTVTDNDPTNCAGTVKDCFR